MKKVRSSDFSRILAEAVATNLIFRGDVTLNVTKRIVVPLILVVGAFGIVLLAEGIRAQRGERPLPIYWSASLLILISTLLLRFWSVDTGRFAEAVALSNPIPDSLLHPQRYLNWMVVAMAVGLVATVLIQSNFFLGAGIYLIMQICLIITFSGILHMQPRRILNSPMLKRPFLITTGFWLIITPLVFILFVYNGAFSLVVVPYVAMLGLMAAVVWLGLGYGKRPLSFRVLGAVGAASFVFSDALIGHMVFVNPETSWQLLISPTYVLAIILLSHALLAWSDVFKA